MPYSQRVPAAVERQGIRPVPMEERTHGWWDLTLVFVGIFTHLVAFAAGADFVRNLGFWRTVLCVTLGGALVIPF
jgi:cytosine/uracil/thiamine/allantoin permease